PLAAGAQDINDGVKDQAVGGRFASALAGPVLRPEDGGDEAPQIIRDVPNCSYWGLGRHGFPPSKDVSTRKVYALKTSFVISRIGSKSVWRRALASIPSL